MKSTPHLFLAPKSIGNSNFVFLSACTIAVAVLGSTMISWANLQATFSLASLVTSVGGSSSSPDVFFSVSSFEGDISFSS